MYEYGDYDGKTVGDWMVSHDTHYDGESYTDIDLEDKESDRFMRGVEFDDDRYSIEEKIDKKKKLANNFVNMLSRDEACACAVLFGKCNNVKKNIISSYLRTNDLETIKKRLSKLLNKFVHSHPELEFKSARLIFYRDFIKLCEDIYKSTPECKQEKFNL